MAFWKGYDPVETVKAQRWRPSPWTLFKEGAAEGFGKAIVEAPIRFGTEIAVDYVSPTRQREREHMGAVEKQAAGVLAETTAENKARGERATATAKALFDKATKDRQQREEQSRRQAGAFLVSPEVPRAPGAGPRSEEVPLPEIGPVVPPPPSRVLPAGAQGLLDTIRTGRQAAEQREQTQGFAPIAGPKSPMPRAAESFGARQLQAEPARAPSYRVDPETGRSLARGYISGEPGAGEEEIVLPGSVQSEFDIMLQQARTEKERALAAKALRQGTGRGGAREKPWTTVDMGRIGDQYGLDSPEYRAAAGAVQAGAGARKWAELLKSQRAFAGGMTGGAPPPAGQPTKLTPAETRARADERADSRQKLAELKEERISDAAAVREGRLDRGEAARRAALRVQAAGKVDIFSDPELLDMKDEILRGAMSGTVSPPQGKTYDLDVLIQKLEGGGKLSPAERTWFDAEKKRQGM